MLMSRTVAGALCCGVLERNSVIKILGAIMLLPHESEVVNMGSKKPGRPTNKPKNISVKFKTDDETF